jgi:hypothetical protein
MWCGNFTDTPIAVNLIFHGRYDCDHPRIRGSVTCAR